MTLDASTALEDELPPVEEKGPESSASSSHWGRDDDDDDDDDGGRQVPVAGVVRSLVQPGAVPTAQALDRGEEDESPHLDTRVIDHSVCPHVQVMIKKKGRLVARREKCKVRVPGSHYYVWCKLCNKAVCNQCALSLSLQQQDQQKIAACVCVSR